MDDPQTMSHRYKIGSEIIATVDLSKAEPIAFQKKYKMKNTGEMGNQFISLALNSWAKFMAVLPDIKAAFALTKESLDNYNGNKSKKSRDLPEGRTWPLSSSLAVFLSSREGSNDYRGKYFPSLSLRGAFEKGKQFYPKRGDGITFRYEEMDSLVRTSYDMYGTIRRTCAQHNHLKKVEPLCDGCKLVQSGPIQCDNIAFKRSDLKEKGVAMIVDSLLDSLSKYEKSGYAGTWLISVGAKSHNVGSLSTKAPGQSHQDDSSKGKGGGKGKGGLSDRPKRMTVDEADDTSDSSTDDSSSSQDTVAYRARHAASLSDNKNDDVSKSSTIGTWLKCKKTRKNVIEEESDGDDDNNVERRGTKTSQQDRSSSTSATAATTVDSREGVPKHKRKKTRFDDEQWGEGRASNPLKQREELEPYEEEGEEEEQAEDDEEKAMVPMILYSHGKLDSCPPQNMVGGWRRVFVTEEDSKKKWVDPAKYWSTANKATTVAKKSSKKMVAAKAAAIRVSSDVQRMLDRYRGLKENNSNSSSSADAGVEHVQPKREPQSPHHSDTDDSKCPTKDVIIVDDDDSSSQGFHPFQIRH